MFSKYFCYRYDKYLVQDKPKAKALDKKGDRFEQQVEDLELEAQNISEVSSDRLISMCHSSIYNQLVFGVSSTTLAFFAVVLDVKVACFPN